MADDTTRSGTLADEHASPSMKWAFSVCAGVYTLVTLAVLPFAHRPGPIVPAATTTFGTAVFLADLCTSVLLRVQSRVAPSWSMLLLAAAYGYSGAMAFLHILTFPGAWVPDAALVGTPQSVGWLFIFWILGYPTLVLAAMVAEARGRHRQMAAAAVNPAIATVFGSMVAVLVVLTLVATTGLRWLPQQLHGDVFAAWGRSAQWTAVGIAMAAFVVLWLVTRGRNVLYGWLSLALIAFMAFNALAVAGGARYTLGWVLSRISGFIAASVLLVFFLGQFAKVHRSLAHILQKVRDANEQLEHRGAERTAALMQANTALQHEIADRRQAEAARRESAARLHAIVQTAVDGIITIDTRGMIASFNPAAERLFGYTADEVLGQNITLLMPSPYREEHDGYLARYRQTGEPHIIGMGREVRAQRRDGTTFPIALAVSEMHLDGRRLFTGIIHDLTERVRMEEALRQHALLLDSSYDPIFVWDEQRGIVLWNQGCERLYGFPPAEALGCSSHVLLQTVFPVPFEAVTTALERDGSWSGELQHTTRDGRQVLVESRFQVVTIDDRPVVLEVVRDIMARKQAEAALRAAMEQLHLVTDAMAVPVTRCSRDLRYLWVSRPYAAWLGQPPEALVGQPIRAVVGEAAFAALAPYFARVLAGEVVRYEEQVTFPGLGPRWISAVYTPTWDAQGVPDGWVAVVLDIEERKQAEVVLRASEARFRTMADAAPVLVWMAGLDMGCTYFNQGWLAFTGRTLDQECGDGWAEGVHPDDYARCLATYQTAFAARQPFEMEYRLRHADGTYRWVLDRGVPLLESGERFEGYIGCAIDITERKAAEAVLQHAQAELEQRVQERTTALAAANEEIRRFAYIVSHDLRAPLINLRGFARELRDAATVLTETLPALVPHLESRQAAGVTRTLDSDIPEALAFIETAVTRMDRLIEAVLQLSRLDRQELHLELVDTTSVVQDTLRTLAHQITQRQVQVHVGPLPVVQADALARAQIFGNLLGNAVAYLDPSRPGVLAITATQPPEQTAFTVQDNGGALPRRIFPISSSRFAASVGRTCRGKGWV